jgi:hypothetical protein
MATAVNLDRPTSLEFIRDTAFVVTFGGEVWKINDVSGPRQGVEISDRRD